MLSEREFLELLKNKNLIPEGNYQHFSQVVGIVKWNSEELKNAFKEAGFEFLESIEKAENLNEVPYQFVRKERLIPLKKEGKTLVVATDNPFNVEGLKKLKWLTSSPVKVVVAPFDEINRLLMEETQETEEEVEEEVKESEDILAITDEAPIVRLVNDILLAGVRARASDIHFEPQKDKMRIRFRIDGVLKTVRTIPLSLVPAVVSRLKIMANLDIAEKRLPQDGRIFIKVGGKEIDVRVSTLPTATGEKVVLRLLLKESILFTTKELGFLEDDYEKFEKLIKSPYGIVLVTGPTGSGKTTTLYAALSEINSEEVNIVTVEDPVEYQLEGISQVQVKPEIGLTFATALRSILRQDPDIIMIGEIRDSETANIAIHSALTGHLVFSTLHTNDSAGAITRLIDMGIEPFLVSSSVIGVVAQRLVRKVCPYCSEEVKPTDEELRELGIEDYRGTIRRGRGCEQCFGTGYLGRTAIYEILVVDKEIRREVLRSSDSDAIKEVAVSKGMRTLRMDGALKVIKGITTPEEVLRVTKV
jgi:type II secretion system protein E